MPRNSLCTKVAVAWEAEDEQVSQVSSCPLSGHGEGVGQKYWSVREKNIEMKCLDCGIETGFEWPGGEDPKERALWEAAYEGPVCKLCSSDSPIRGLLDSLDPEQFCFTLRRRQNTDRGSFDFDRLLNSGDARSRPDK